MKPLLLINIILFSCFSGYSQDGYEKYLFAKKSQKENAKVKSRTVYIRDDSSKWKRVFFTEYLKGMPREIIQYDHADSIESRKTEFSYKVNGNISKIDSYKEGNKESSLEFELNSNNQIASYSVYIYNKETAEKIVFEKTYFEYYPNHILHKMITIDTSSILHTGDTIEISEYNSAGVEAYRFRHFAGPVMKTKFIWNANKTEMQEANFSDDTLSYTIFHYYEDDKEIKRIDKSISKIPIYWKYDKKGRVVETNELLYFKTENFYGEQYLIRSINTQIFPLNGQEPRTMELKYEYIFIE